MSHRVFLKKKVLDNKNENTISFAILNLASVGFYAGSLFFALGYAPYSLVPSLFVVNIRKTHENNMNLAITLPQSIVLPKRALLMIAK